MGRRASGEETKNIIYTLLSYFFKVKCRLCNVHANELYRQTQHYSAIRQCVTRFGIYYKVYILAVFKPKPGSKI